MPESELKFAVEAILFASERPLTPEELKEAFDGAVVPAEVREALAALGEDYRSQRRGFALKEIAGGFQIVTDERFSDILKKFYQNREKKKMSPASLETLSIVAYKQPVTKADIEFIRGVNVDGPLKTLLERNLIRIAGRKEVPGRPILYGTSKVFLERFGLASLKELPPLSEFTQKDIDPGLLPPELKRPDAVADDAAGESPADSDAAENEILEAPEMPDVPQVNPDSPRAEVNDERE